MSAKSVGKSVADEKAVDTKETVAGTVAAGQEPKFKVEKLRANSTKLFSVTTSTFDGAMYGHKETEMTIAEARTIINRWLGGKE